MRLSPEHIWLQSLVNAGITTDNSIYQYAEKLLDVYFKAIEVADQLYHYNYPYERLMGCDERDVELLINAIKELNNEGV